MAKDTRMCVSDVMKICGSISMVTWSKMDSTKRTKMSLRNTEQYKRRQTERVGSKERRAIRRREETWEE